MQNHGFLFGQPNSKFWALYALQIRARDIVALTCSMTGIGSLKKAILGVNDIMSSNADKIMNNLSITELHTELLAQQGLQ